MKLLLGLVLILALAGAGLLAAIRINGPAVLDTLDRIAGGSRGTTLVAQARYGPAAAQKLRLYTGPASPASSPIIVFVHGGSWSWGDPDDYGFVARTLGAEGFVVGLAGYRLGAEGRYPAMLQDPAAAIAAATRLSRAHGGDPARILLVGHSAGAYNVVQVALERQWLAAAGVESASICGVVGLSGPYDFFPFDKESSRAAFGSVGAGAGSQPINHARADAPPMLLIHGERDTLVKPRNTRALTRALHAAGAAADAVHYPAFDHNAPLISLASPWASRRDVARRIVGFANRNCAVSVPVQTRLP